MIRITQSEWDKIPDCYKSTWTTERTDIPNWEKERHLYMGKRTWLHKGALQIEGLSFKITPNFADDEFMRLYTQFDAVWRSAINPETRNGWYGRLQEIRARADEAHDAGAISADEWHHLVERHVRLENAIRNDLHWIASDEDSERTMP